MARNLALSTIFSVLVNIQSASAAPVIEKRNEFSFVQWNPYGDAIFELGNVTYLANTKHPKTTIAVKYKSSSDSSLIPITVIKTNASSISKDVLTNTIDSYLAGDDVFTEDFLETLYISTSLKKASLDESAIQYLSTLNPSHLFLDSSISSPKGKTKFSQISVPKPATDLPAGPYVVSLGKDSGSLASVYRLYEDTYRTFLYGTYDANDGQDSHYPLGVFLPKFWDPMIPVPSRIYSWGDTRPLAGERVGVKDLYDVKGLTTSGGSRAWAYITPTANATAPSIQRILDLGGVVVGKQKLAQFASGANPWEFQEQHYPFNPRGDGWQTCSASSSGGGCSIAAYDWLDFAIGSDTGSSMRRPAAVSGTYGQRPSQGMISLERVMPLGAATDTAGVFARDPYKWIKFSKAWYTPELFQPSSVTGLSPLVVPDTDAFPKTILYPVEYLPLNSTAAEAILQDFIADLVRIFDMKVKKFNFTATVQNASDPVVNLATLSAATTVINQWTQWKEVAEPLITTWKSLFDGRFPPIDPARRPGWINFNRTRNNAQTYAQSLINKNIGTEWYEENIQYSTPESCSESVLLTDIGTGGKPSYREERMNESPDASYLGVLPKGAAISVANICPIFGCADFTIPIGQVPYFSNITFREEMMPVTINMAVKRGCDFVLYNMIEKLADEGVLKAVKTGREAF